MLQAFEFLAGQATALHPLLIAGRAGAHRVHLVLEAALLVGDIARAGLRVQQLVGERGPLSGPFGERGEFGQGVSPMRELGQGGVRGLKIEQSELYRVIGLHRHHPRDGVDDSCIVHGSVTIRETRTSTLVLKRSCNRVATTSSHGASVAQCAASTNAMPSARSTASSRAGWCLRSAVSRTSAPASRAADASEPPAPPHTATWLTGRDGSPAARTPHTVAGRAAAA
jgi:hypothetical protein